MSAPTEDSLIRILGSSGTGLLALSLLFDNHQGIQLFLRIFGGILILLVVGYGVKYVFVGDYPYFKQVFVTSKFVLGFFPLIGATILYSGQIAFLLKFRFIGVFVILIHAWLFTGWFFISAWYNAITTIPD